MYRKSKNWAVAGLLFGAALAVAFAGGGSEKAGNAQPQGPVEFRVSWWGATGRNEKYLKIMEEYQKRNPSVKLTPEYQGWADYWSKMATLVAARNLPDVHQYTNNQLGEYQSKGAIVSLEPYVKSGVIKLDDWNKAMVDSGRINGELVAITIGITGPAMIFNVSWAEELGIKIPPFDHNWTWNQFAAWLKQDVQPKLPAGAYAFGDYGQAENYFWTWIRQNDAKWIDANGKYAVPASVLESWYAFMDDLRKSKVSPPLEFTMEDLKKARGENGFNKRRILIYPTNANQAKLEQKFMANPGDRVELRRLPRREGAATAAECLITSALTISATSKFKDEAAKYIQFFVNDTVAQEIYGGEIGVPGSLTVQKLLRPKLDKVAAQEFDYINLIAGPGSPPTEPKPKGVWAFDAEVQQMNQRVAVGEVTPAQAAQAIIERANKFLSTVR
ncbi:MAG: extracellular solute-binding protein [Treponemataceae bacterium]